MKCIRKQAGMIGIVNGNDESELQIGCQSVWTRRERERERERNANVVISRKRERANYLYPVAVSLQSWAWVRVTEQATIALTLAIACFLTPILKKKMPGLSTFSTENIQPEIRATFTRLEDPLLYPTESPFSNVRPL